MRTLVFLKASLRAGLALAGAVAWNGLARADDIPRPEHPTPDAVRPHWANLNGPWQFRFDPRDEGRRLGWEQPDAPGFDRTIVVPFPWESRLSGVHQPETTGVAWYRRAVSVPASFPADQRVWLRFGAADWEAEVWVNGKSVARHEGGYTPFEADVTEALRANPGRPAVITVRVFDPTDPSLPTGKQVGWYTHTSGLWQTVWLECRPQARVARWSVVTTLDPPSAAFAVDLEGLAPGSYTLALRGTDPGLKPVSTQVVVPNEGKPAAQARLELPVENARLWTPEDPHLYGVTLELTPPAGSADTVQTYFGLRTVARGKYGDAPYERLLLNGKPLYLRAALDQSFNPEGIYTSPTDADLRRDLAIARSNGLNALRIHIKPDEPRRLYWADRMGLLILEDMPNTWEQNPRARAAWEGTMREVVARDRNHPAIITWVAFNETWGLGAPPKYKADADTQAWVSRMVSEVRKLDPTRLVEDNSPCNYDHVENTDLNSWHFYIDDHEGAAAHIADVVKRTEPGSTFNYCPGNKQGTAPLINSEYGGVGAGNGDRDVSWCFRDLTTLLRRQPKIQGYVYTELTDIEWEHNGFADYDRSPKAFGYDAFVPGMQPTDLNGADFVGFDGPPAVVVRPGATVTVTPFVSHYSERAGVPQIRWWWSGQDDRGANLGAAPETRPAAWSAYGVTAQAPVTFKAPDRPFVGAVGLVLLDGDGLRVAANYVNVVVRPETPLPRAERVGDREVALRFAPGDFARRSWSGGFGSPRGKVYGRGKGSFEYRVSVPPAVVAAGPGGFRLRIEAGSKGGREQVDFADRVSPEDYPQTDARAWPSTLDVAFNGRSVGRQALADDPADSRGVLSHVARIDPGSYGQVVEVRGEFTEAERAELARGAPLTVRLSVPEDAQHPGGLSLYGADSGAWPFDPTLTVDTTAALPTDLGVKPDAPVTRDRLADRTRVVLATGEAGAPGVWSYTTKDPGAGWEGPAFEAGSWVQGPGGFGTRETPGLRTHTPWDSDRIWLRTAVTLPKLKADDQVTLRLFHDEDAEVLVNGKALLSRPGYGTAYEDVTLTEDQKAHFREGSNTIGVTCRQTRGGQGIDLGLTLQRGD